MSRAAFESVLDDYATWDRRAPWEDVICLKSLSKDLTGEVIRPERVVQPCEELGCESVKSYFTDNPDVAMDVTAGPCDGVPDLDGKWTNFEAVRVGRADPPRRAGHTGRFVWSGASGSTALVRFRGMSRVGTHRAPYFTCGDGSPCEECHVPFHWEGWLRGAIEEGEHEGCRLWATYAFKLTELQEEPYTARIEGTVEGLVGCQCDPNAD